MRYTTLIPTDQLAVVMHLQARQRNAFEDGASSLKFAEEGAGQQQYLEPRGTGSLIRQDQFAVAIRPLMMVPS